MVIPTRTNEQGYHLSRHSHFLNKRSADSGRKNDRIFYSFDAFGRTFRLTLSPHIGFVAPGLRLHHLDVNNTWVGDEAAESAHCYHRGSVDGDPNSVVVVSVCEQLVSIVTRTTIVYSQKISIFFRISPCFSEIRMQTLNQKRTRINGAIFRTILLNL